MDLVDLKLQITYYDRNGAVNKTEPLTPNNLGGTAGMMIRCHLADGTKAVGFADPFRTKDDYDGKIHNVIYLWTWANLDEETHKLTGKDSEKFDQVFTAVEIDKICAVEAILYSNPRWGVPLTNRFFIDT